MQFIYEREGNNCWLTDKLIFEKSTVIHYQLATGNWGIEDTSYIKIDNLLNYLKGSNLTLDNFSGLEDYLKENYPEVLLKDSKEPDYKKLLENLVKLIKSDIDFINDYSNPELGKAEEFKAACLALDPD